MNYILFDLEFNQEYPFAYKNKERILHKCPFEIIQIGAVKLDKNLQTVSTLDTLIKPEIFTTIHPFVEEMTGITMEQLNTEKSFKEVYNEFTEFIKVKGAILCVWGMTDLKELFRNIEYYGLRTETIPKEYINLQLYASKYLHCPQGINIGLQNAVELLNIPITNQFHNAFNDAYYTAEIFKKIYNKTMKPLLYAPHKYRRLTRTPNEKQKLDMDALLKQFEKMFNREITTEEKSIIKLAYMMGKTNQFQIKN